VESAKGNLNSMQGDDADGAEADPNQEKKYIEIGEKVLKDVDAMVKKITEQVTKYNRLAKRGVNLQSEMEIMQIQMGIEAAKIVSEWKSERMQRIKNDIDAYTAAGKAISGKDAEDLKHSNNAVIARLSERYK